MPADTGHAAPALSENIIELNRLFALQKQAFHSQVCR